MSNRASRTILSVWILTMLTSGGDGATRVREYVLPVQNERFTYVARPELGYVVKARPDAASIEVLDGILKHAGAVDIRPVGGLGRKGISIVRRERPAKENEKTIETLQAHSDVRYAAPLFSSNGEPVAIIPEIVIRVKPGMAMDQVQTLCERTGCTIIERMEFTEQEYLIEVLGTDAKAVFTAVEQLNGISSVEWACPNIAFQPKLCGQALSSDVIGGGQLRTDVPMQDVNSPGVFPNDVYFPYQWHLHNTGQSGGTPGADIRAPEAWEITTGDPNVVIAICDFGIDPNHPDLIPNIVSGYDFWDDDSEAYPSHDYWYEAHGTMCAGIVSAQGNNVLGVTGVTWNCKLMPIRFDINGYRQMDEVGIASAFRWAASQGADILSNSWNWNLGDNPTPIIKSALEDITRVGGIGREGKGCIVFCSAGNKGRSLRYIEKYHEVVSVGATDHNDDIWWYSNHGPELDIVAPSGGESDEDWFATSGRDWLWTTDINGIPGYSLYHADYGLDPNILDYTLIGGTSGACPIAAGVAALVLSVNPDLTHKDVKEILYRSARDLGEPGWDPYYGWGRVDARAAVEIAMNTLPLEEEVVYIQWLGHATVKVWTEDCIVYVDPERVPESLHDATLVCVTHTHGDHYSPSDIAKISNAQTQFIGPSDMVQRYGNGQTIAPGQAIKFDFVNVIAVPAYNTNKPNHPKSNNWVGFIIELGGKRIYVAGDTDLIEEMHSLGDIDVAFLPAGGTYTMNAVEAAEATQYIKPELAIPYHWGQNVGTLADAQRFAELARCAVKILVVGETIGSDEWPEYQPLLAHWALDEMEGDIAYDSTGDHHGALNGDPIWLPVDGKIDGALQFDGVDDYLTTPTVLDPADGVFSTFAWMKGGAAGHVILSQEDGMGMGETWLGANPLQGNLVSGLVPPPAGRTVTPALESPFVITDGQWHHIGFVWDGQRRHLYADGVEVAVDDSAIDPLSSSNGGMYIGAGKSLDAGTFFSGLIDDVRMYDQALDEQEVNALVR